MRVNQKYFALRDSSTGKLAPNFICVANIDAKDGGKAIVAGNEKVLAARLADAKFFWEQDRKTKLADFAGKLDQIVFRSEERRVGKECAVRVDLGGRRIIK